MPYTVALVGAGEAVLRLGIGLVKTGIHTTIFTNRTAQQVLNGSIMSSQGIFDQSLRIDRKLGINFWDKTCPQNKSVKFVLGQPGTNKIGIQWEGFTRHFYQSVDQRVKFSRWMTEFENIGGKLHREDVDLKELDKIAKWNDLTIVGGGKGEISQSFARDNARSHFDSPQRALACMYVRGIENDNTHQGVRGNIIPGVGEFFIMPGLTINNQVCRMLLFEGIPGGAFDCWDTIKKPEQRLAKGLELLRQFIPWEFERSQNFELTDANATLVGRYTPTVRHPTLKMPCGKSVLGIGDTVVLNDPIAGQGGNNAAKAVDIYLNSIREHGNKKFDEEWMRETFEKSWNQYGKWGTEWTNTLLMPPKPHTVQLLAAAQSIPNLANMLANAFDDPSTLYPWISDPEKTLTVIKKAQELETLEVENDTNISENVPRRRITFAM